MIAEEASAGAGGQRTGGGGGRPGETLSAEAIAERKCPATTSLPPQGWHDDGGEPVELARAKRCGGATPEEREREFEERYAVGGFPPCGVLDLFSDRRADEIVWEFLRDKIREIVKDPEVAEVLSRTTVRRDKRM